MTHKTFINSLRHIAIFLAVIGFIGTAQSVSAQKKVKSPTKPVVVFAPSYICDTDFTGDQLNDVVFFNTTTANWITYRSDSTISSIDFGTRGDLPVAADYDGDEIVDIAVVHNENGLLKWQILQSSDGATPEVKWGMDGDVPVKGDYDGDGKTDIAVWRPSEGVWYILTSSSGELLTISHGLSTDLAVPGDYDGDAKTDVAVFSLRNMAFSFVGSFDDVVHTQSWGSLFVKGQETFVPADYDGDEITDFAIFNARTGAWTIRQSSDGLYRTENFDVTPSICNPWDINPCIENDFAFPSDYDNDGKADPAVWSSQTGDVNAIGSLNGAMLHETTMLEGEMPVSTFFMMK